MIWRSPVIVFHLLFRIKMVKTRRQVSILLTNPLYFRGSFFSKSQVGHQMEKAVIWPVLIKPFPAKVSVSQ